MNQQHTTTRMTALNLFWIWLCLLSASFSSIAEVGSAKNLAENKAVALKALHAKAETALVAAAQNENYIRFLENHDHHLDASLRKRVDRVSLNVQKEFQVEEMCLIHKDGHELSRIVGNSVATDLSTDETGASFFDPAFSLQPKKAYISRVYMSPDVNKLVLAYVTPVFAFSNNEAILHFELGLDYFQQELSKDLEVGKELIIAVDEAQLVVSDSRSSIDVNKKGDNEDVGSYLKKFTFADKNLAQLKADADRGVPVKDKDGTKYDIAYRQVDKWSIFALVSL